MAQLVKNPPSMQEAWVWSLGWEDPLEKGTATPSSVLAWRIAWTVWPMGLQRVGLAWATFTFAWSDLTYLFPALFPVTTSFQRIPIPSLFILFFPRSNTFLIVQLPSCVWLRATPWTAAHCFPVPISQSLLRFMSTEPMMPSNHLILCCSLLLLPSTLPIIRVFPNESAVCIRWPNYWSFSFSPSSEYSGLISFRMNWFDLKSHRFFIFCL